MSQGLPPLPHNVRSGDQVLVPAIVTAVGKDGTWIRIKAEAPRQKASGNHVVAQAQHTKEIRIEPTSVLRMQDIDIRI